MVVARIIKQATDGVAVWVGAADGFALGKTDGLLVRVIDGIALKKIDG